MANLVLEGPSGGDITTALQAALNNSVAVGGVLTIKPGSYTVSSTITCNISVLAATPFGLSAKGVRLTSTVGNGNKVLDFTSTDTNEGTRYFFIEGLQIIGSGSEGVGLSIRAENGNNALANSTISDISIEGCGGDGCQIRGNVFESTIYNSFFWNNALATTLPAGSAGAAMSIWTTSGGGLPSALHIHGCSFPQNLVGLITTADSGASPPNDIYILDTYFRDSKNQAIVGINGLAMITGCGFENNWRTFSVFNPATTPQPAIYAAGGVRIDKCRALTGSGSGQTHLLQIYLYGPTSYLQGTATIIDSSSESEGGSTPHMAYINNNSNSGPQGTLNLLNLGAIVLDNVSGNPNLTINQFATTH